MNTTAQQEKAMDIRKSPASATDAAATARSGAAGTATAGTFRIRYGRTGIALAGLAALLTAFVSGVLLPFGLGPAVLPVCSFVVALSSVVLLRWLAVRDRKARVEAAFTAAMGAPSRGPDSSVAAGATDAMPKSTQAQPESPLFDAEAHQPKAKPLTAMELREAALAVALVAGDTSVRAAAAASTAGGTWEPVDVPKPVYVEAAKAERPAPEPLDLPEAPKAVGKPSLKQGVPAAPASTPSTKPLTKAQSALSNLDDVLQRRRA